MRPSLARCDLPWLIASGSPRSLRPTPQSASASRLTATNQCGEIADQGTGTSRAGSAVRITLRLVVDYRS
jgi:hypothetical protein